ncbi:MAG TPA: glutamine synthetase family protein [Pseudomonadales bacterium]|jgi:glutamine synthetase
MGKPSEMPDELELLLSDMNGVPRGKTLRGISYSEAHPPHLAEAIFFQTITGGYAAAMETYDPNDRDLLLRPDWSTYVPTPWKPDTGQVICESLDQAGERLPYDPRNVLRRVLDAYESMGLRPVVAPEVEFYLLEAVSSHDLVLTPATGRSGAAEFGGESFSPDALEKFMPIVAEIQQACRQTGLELSAMVHEMGPAQIELNVAHGDALSRADQLFQLKRLIKGCARKHGALASFMAKPLADLPGNGLHLHCSMEDETGRNIFALNRRRAPAVLQHFIAGLQAHLPQAFALVAPNVNSYKRFVRDLSAPINLEWGYDNRTTGFRVPFSDARAGRVENRVAGADANPYLIIAATLACGLLGMRAAIKPTKPIADDAYGLKPALPEDLGEALRILEQSEGLIDLLGEAFVEVFVSVKRGELDHFGKTITQWEVGYLGSTL